MFLGLQLSRSAAGPRPPAEVFQRTILSTVANTQPETAVHYGLNAVTIGSLRKAFIPTVFVFV